MYRAREENNSLRVSTVSEGTSEDDEKESGLKEVRLDEEGGAAEVGSQGNNSSDSSEYPASTPSEEEGQAPEKGEKDENHEEPAYKAYYDKLQQAVTHLLEKGEKSSRTIHALEQRLDKAGEKSSRTIHALEQRLDTANAEIASRNIQYNELARNYSVLSTKLGKSEECLEQIEMEVTLRLHLHRSKENTPTPVLFPLPRSSSPVLSDSPLRLDSSPGGKCQVSSDTSEEEPISPKEWSPTFIHRGSDSRDRPSSPGPRGIRPPATSTAF